MADVVVVGGGVMGASVAYQLACRGARVTVIDRGAICSGQTRRSGGFVQTHWDTLAEVRLIAWSREMFADWGARVGGDCGYVRGGYLHVTGSDREPDVRRVHDMLCGDGLESHWLDRDALGELEPGLNLDRLIGGAWEPASGWADPLATTRGFIAAATSHGAIVREHVTATAIGHRGGRVTHVATSAGDLACDAAVVAAGPHTLALHPDPAIALPISIERGQVGHFVRPPGVARRTAGFYDEVTGLYTHPLGDLDLVGRDRDFPFVHVVDPDEPEPAVAGKWTARAALALGYRFPALREATLHRGVSGLYDFTPDGQPIVDGPIGGLTGYYVCAGFSGVGFKSSPAIGLALAELIVDGRASTLSIDHLRLTRFEASNTAAGR